MVHGWQNDGYQKGLFYGVSEENECPAGCGEIETRQHYMHCKTPELCKSYQQHRVLFNQVHVKLHTVQAVYHALTNILTTVREGANPILVLHFDSDINKAIRVAWNEQKETG